MELSISKLLSLTNLSLALHVIVVPIRSKEDGAVSVMMTTMPFGWNLAKVVVICLFINRTDDCIESLQASVQEAIFPIP